MADSISIHRSYTRYYITHSKNVAELNVGREYWRGVVTIPY